MGADVSVGGTAERDPQGPQLAGLVRDEGSDAGTGINLDCEVTGLDHVRDHAKIVDDGAGSACIDIYANGSSENISRVQKADGYGVSEKSTPMLEFPTISPLFVTCSTPEPARAKPPPIPSIRPI